MRSLLLLSSVSLLGMVACHPPVDEDADVYVRGRVLDVDGTPLSGQKVELYKATAPFWVFGNWLEHILEEEGNTFRTATTDASGDFEIHMTGADANTPGGNYAAYFAVAAFRDTDRQMAVVTEDHVFSNADLIWETPQMQYWDLASVQVNPSTLYMDFTWTDLPRNATHDFLFYINDGDWAEWADKNATAITDVPVEVLNPDKNACSWQMIAWSAGLRYRTSRQTFSNQNVFSAIDPASITDGLGNELPGASDGEYTDKQRFDPSGDKRVVLMDLGAMHEVTAFVVHHSWILSFWQGTVVISTSINGTTWETWDTVSGAHEDWGLFFHHKIDPGGRACQYIRIELSGPKAVEFDYLGELTAFGSPL